jgi:hypothetical protein
MSHVRTQIRARVVDVLTGLTTSGDRVFKTRVHPMSPGSLPGLCVYTGSEAATGGTLKATTKEVELVIDAYAAGVDFDDTADLMQAEVEAALFDDWADGRFFDGIATNLVYSQSDSKFDGEGAVRVGVCRAIYKVEYQTEDGYAETAI